MYFEPVARALEAVNTDDLSSQALREALERIVIFNPGSSVGPSFESGTLTIGAVDLYGNDASQVYYDNIFLCSKSCSSKTWRTSYEEGIVRFRRAESGLITITVTFQTG